MIAVVSLPLNPQWRRIPPESKAIIDRLLLERVPVSGIARVMQVSEDWLQGYVNRCYETVPQKVQVLPKDKGHLEVQMDELWSFVDDKGNKQWVWLAIDVVTREIVGCYRARPFYEFCCCFVAIDARSISTVRGDLHRLLGSLCDGTAE